jgi:UDP-N-acetylglucosamine pyrophosphorylase
VKHLRRTTGSSVRFMLMNSFSTSADTDAYLAAKYPQLAPEGTNFHTYFTEEVEIRQSMTPKILRGTLEPVTHAGDDGTGGHEWCPPGHGELWGALGSSGKLQRLLDDGLEYMFVSNADNLGATMDPALLAYLADHQLDFLLEVAERTRMDVKGSHVARFKQGGRLLVRELAQTIESEHSCFYDFHTHRLFNTNSLWISLRSLKEKLDACDGVMPLPVVRNPKHVVPTDKATPAVFQLECAVGTAIQLFNETDAVIVPRSRFSPVKMCNDLLAVRSDCYVVNGDGSVSLAPERDGMPPEVTLDTEHFAHYDKFEELMAGTTPSLLLCNSLTISGSVRLSQGTKFVGDVTVLNEATDRKVLPPGTYSGNVAITPPGHRAVASAQE